MQGKKSGYYPETWENTGNILNFLCLTHLMAIIEETISKH